MENQQKNFIIFKTEDEKISVDVLLDEETVWLTQAQMGMLFNKDKRTMSEHINNIFKEGELAENSVVRKFRTTASDGKSYDVNYYNLDVIISVGYRVKSQRGTQFRIWATQRLNEYIRKGFTMDDERLKNLGGGGYWKELCSEYGTFGPRRKYSTGRYSIFMLPVSIMIRRQMLLSCFSKRYKTKSTMQFMDKQLPR